MNIVLIGYRGTGKSVVSEILSTALKMKRIDIDAEIVNRAGRPIPEIVKEYGWDRFREIETEVALEVSQLDHVIVDTGGGIIERTENIDALKKNGFIFWLKASVDIVVARIESDTERPALTEGKSFTEEVAEVLKKRTPKYLSAAQYVINTDDTTPDRVAGRIIEIYKKNLAAGGSG